MDKKTINDLLISGQISSDFNITTLILNEKELTSLEGIEKFQKLEVLQLNNNYLTDITQLSNLCNLKDLWLFSNFITDLTPVANLTRLMLQNIQVDKITPFRKILINNKNLKTADIRYTPIYHTLNTININSLRMNLIDCHDELSLDIADNVITIKSLLENNILPLDNKITKLDLTNITVNSLDGIEYYENLEELVLINNNLLNHNNLIMLKNLKKLIIEDNYIQST